MVKSAEENEFEVESILDKKVQGKTSFYLIKWKGFGEDECTWEPLINLQNCIEAINKFDKLVVLSKLRESTVSRQDRHTRNIRVARRKKVKHSFHRTRHSKEREIKNPAILEIPEMEENENDIKEISCILFGEDNQIYGEVHWNQKGKKSQQFPLVELNKKFPRAMCNFYYNHLTFVRKPRVELEMNNWT